MTPLEAAQHLSDLKANKWTSDEWDLFWSTLGLLDNINAEMEAHWNDGYENGLEDGGHGDDESYDEGYKDGIEEGIRRATKSPNGEIGKNQEHT